MSESNAERMLAVASGRAEELAAPGLSPRPRRKVAVLSCMDTRIDLFPMLGIERGDAHIIRNAGGLATDDAIRSLSVSQRLLGTEEVVVVMHDGCGLLGASEDDYARALAADGARPSWRLGAFENVEDALRDSLRAAALGAGAAGAGAHPRPRLRPRDGPAARARGERRSPDGRQPTRPAACPGSMFGAGGAPRASKRGLPVTRVAVLGAGTVAAQIGCEYALGGCSVLWAGDDDGRRAARRGGAAPRRRQRARRPARPGAGPLADGRAATRTISSVGAAHADRRRAVGPARAARRGDRGRSPRATRRRSSRRPCLAAVGRPRSARRPGVGERMLATRYGEPPLLCPVVELLAARDTPAPAARPRLATAARARQAAAGAPARGPGSRLRAARARAAARGAPGCSSAASLDAEDLDELVRDSLARRWALAGPLESAALGRATASCASWPATCGPSAPVAARASPRDRARLAPALRERATGARAGAPRASRQGPRGGAARRATRLAPARAPHDA